MCRDDDVVCLNALTRDAGPVRVLGVGVNHDLAAQVDPLRFGAGAEDTK